MMFCGDIISTIYATVDKYPSIYEEPIERVYVIDESPVFFSYLDDALYNLKGQRDIDDYAIDVLEFAPHHFAYSITVEYNYNEIETFSYVMIEKKEED